MSIYNFFEKVGLSNVLLHPNDITPLCVQHLMLMWSMTDSGCSESPGLAESNQMNPYLSCAIDTRGAIIGD